ncbi:MAG TPA: sigma-70 family RNA polymerase sigma factor [Polyangiaceae bacterium]
MRAFLETYAAFILRLARGVVGEARGALTAEDLAHEVIVDLLRMHDAGTFDPARVENPEGYLRVVVRNAGHRARRRTTRGEALGRADDAAAPGEDGGPPLDSERAPSPEELTRRTLDARRTLERLKRALRPRDALVLALLVEERLDIEEIAVRIGTTRNNIYQIRHRILEAAREVLDKTDAPGALDPSRGIP